MSALGLLAPVFDKILGIGSDLVDGKIKKEEAMAQLAALVEEGQQAAEKARYDQYSSEYTVPTNWFDSFVNGMNRLIRPTVAFGLFATLPWMLWYASVDAQGFSQFADAFNLIPTLYWALFISVFGFYFGFRGFKDIGEFIPKNKITWFPPKKGAK